MPEYSLAPRSFYATALCASAVAYERSATMYELEYYQAVQADRQRQAAWADKHAWKYEELRQQRARRRSAAVARVLRALAARLALVDAGSVVEHSQLSVERGA
jgi:hypothetical protein